MTDFRCQHGARGPQDCPLCRNARTAQERQGAALARIGLPAPAQHGQAVGPAITFTTRLQAQFSMPYTDQGAQTRWSRSSGSHTLVLTAGPSFRPDGSISEVLPFGTTPRLLMMWLTTQAVITRSPVIDLGDSLRAFVTDVGIPAANARQRARLLDQLRRVTAMRYTLLIGTGTETNAYQSSSSRQVVDDLELWFSRGDASTENTLMTSQITLSDKFFAEFVDRAIPLRTEHLRALSRKGAQGLTLDVYAWLAYRTHGLDGPRRVTWQQAEMQFGACYDRSRDFRRRLRVAIAEVTGIHHGFRLQQDDEGILLLPSRSPVAARRAT